MRRTVRHAGAALAVGALVLGVAACGDDDEGAQTQDATLAADGGGASDGFCEAAAAVDEANLGTSTGEASPDDVEAAFQEALDTAPAALVGDVQVMVDEGRALAEAPETPDGPPPMPSPAFYDSAVVVADHLVDACDFGTVEVTAADYAFEGIPGDVPAGTTVFTFDNGGSEFHEMVLVRIRDGEDRPVEELLALPEEEQMAIASEQAFVLAPPGAGSFVTADLEAGRYVALCFVPLGATPEALESGAALDGEPHMAHGMVAEFTVA